jgi:tRNA(Arg) A34 adenosine deaminase TadA
VTGGRHTSLICLAIRQAQRSRCRIRVGAILVSGSRVLAAASNIHRNSPVIDFQHATFHAEEAVLRKVNQPAGAVVYVARINALGEPRLARPCPRCQAALAAAGVRFAYYTSETAVEGLAVGSRT